MAKVLVACEYSGVVRDAFIRAGHDAMSCDLLPSESALGEHYQGSVLDILEDGWDLVIAHPPCTRLCSSGARWKYEKPGWAEEQEEAAEFFLRFTKLECAWAIENPVGIMSTRFRKPDQIIQPWMFGHGETKATCLWLNGLPTLYPTKIVEGREARIHKMPPSKDRGKLRSRFYEGIADAMAQQWGRVIEERVSAG